MGAVRAQAHLGHRVEDPALHRLQAVAGVGQGAGVDDRVGVLQERPLHLLLDVDVDDALGEVLGRRRWRGSTAGHGPIIAEAGVSASQPPRRTACRTAPRGRPGPGPRRPRLRLGERRSAAAYPTDTTPDRGAVGRDVERTPGRRRAAPGATPKKQEPSPASTAVSSMSIGGHAGVDVPVGDRPAGLVAVGPALVRLGVPVQVGVLVAEADHEQGRGLHPEQPAGPARPARAVTAQKRSRSAGSRSTRKSQPWLKPALGARIALCSNESTTSSGTGRSGS